MAKKVKANTDVSYELICAFVDKNPLLRELKFSNHAEFIEAGARLFGDNRVYQAFQRNEGINFKALKKLPSILSNKPTKVLRELKTFIFTAEQLVTNALMVINGNLKGLTKRAIEIYQLIDAGVLLKNITDYLRITTGTVYGNCSFSRDFLKVGCDFDVLKILKA